MVGVIILMGVWQFGSSMLIFLAALKQIPGSLYESAMVDGAKQWTMFWKITLPMLTPTISDELEASDLKLIPLVFAGWLRYLMAVDDNGNAFEPSSDPMLAELTPYLKDIKWNDEQAEKKILPILAKSEIFGVNLAEAGLLCRVVKYFKELIAGVGAVRTTLHKYVSNN